MHPRFRVVTQTDNVARQEQEFVMKVRQKSLISEKAYQ